VERDILVLFEYERKRRPELAVLAARIDTMTEEQIRAADVPLPWMRAALLRLKAKRRADVLRGIIERTVVDGVTADPMGIMRRWEGSETYIRMSNQGRPIASLLITHGTLVWLDATSMWIDTIHTTTIDDRLYANTVACGNLTRSAYNLAVRERARNTTMSEQIQETTSQVRFFRPG
jgi:hypothetical protein